MATLTHSFKLRHVRVAFTEKRDRIIERLMPRRCMLVSTGLILAGLSIPVLMILDVLPITLLLGFIGFALGATGGVMALVLCGEI